MDRNIRTHVEKTIVGSESTTDSNSLNELVQSLNRIAGSLSQLEEFAGRVVERMTPSPQDKVGTPFVADLLGYSTIWVAELARDGQIPHDCIVPGSGNGKPWKFYRGKIEAWIKSR